MLFRAATSGNTIQLSGELDLNTVRQLNEALAPMVSAGGAITLDLSESRVHGFFRFAGDL